MSLIQNTEEDLCEEDAGVEDILYSNYKGQLNKN